ncbi:methanol/ethanol family PQQ-dependent dehydrogenase [Methylomonas sp. BW4-1]|uniref:methanol/ethanol family PQQ-dependent dehydrogenase n=1 Tax=unclassified Methylomonas TaxID=2608980 RepID=UPI00051B1E87|nr:MULTISPECIES: methanol/ethanol family PQQ-dependent dehydrogenase [unclassified Methylomonas]NOV29505.1 PQQ-dependent dehydrogenase, methanol/ethanol family [Methylomonas sp. ZR1]PKD40959.1 PQQ-dependent dehydrogenase, methanol/ethanol family [Methylomonas sp. Kb3]QBC27574.1 PQQ-dependent dehydrogenase, methanol/ethanol family [Methylomonas sp. LW13]QSA99446.1 methanol/ethanol family PQQ-dependent dehydrogenase [Methylomonas sp. EFPC1]
MQISRFAKQVSTTALVTAAALAVSSSAQANKELEQLAKQNTNWVMQTKDYGSTHFSEMIDINANNVKNLKVAWSFSTGVLNGHEGGPLVVDGIMYVHTPYPNNVFAISLDEPDKILWQFKPKQNPAARAVACCDVVNRGLAYAPAGKDYPATIFLNQLDGHVVAINAKTGEVLWKMENSDIAMGSTLTVAPFVVKDKVIVGTSGAELGVRGYATAYNIKDGKQAWRVYATGPDEDIKLSKDFNSANPHYGQFGLGLKTWEGDAWKIGGGTNWGWYAYDSDLEMLYYGSGNPAPWNETMRPGDNKWTMTIWGRDVNTGEAKFGYQKTPHDEWDYAGVNYMGLSEQMVDGKMTKLLTHPDRNGLVYTLNRENGSLVNAFKIDDTVNWVKKVDLKTGLPIRDPEYSTHMDHQATGICPSAMGYHNQGIESYDPNKKLFFMGTNHICMDWEPFMLPYRAGQFFVGATLNMYPGPKGTLGQVKAMNAVTGKMEWEVQEKFAVWGGTTATAGDLVFYGTLDGYIKARHSKTGEELWKFKLPSGVIGHPITYKHNNKQYVAIYYGVGGWPGVGLVFDLADPTAGLGAVGAFKELAHYTQMGGGVMVFAL